MSEVLRHYSREPVTHALYSTTDRLATDDKPVGLWVSVDGGGEESPGWADWCRSEEWGTDRLVHAAAVGLAEGASILRLSSAADIDRLTAEFGFDLYGGRFSAAGRFHHIDWPRIAKRYQGVIIAPYIWARRLDGPSRWYYGWDCASGCIWDVSAIASLTPIQCPPLPTRGTTG